MVLVREAQRRGAEMTATTYTSPFDLIDAEWVQTGDDLDALFADLDTAPAPVAVAPAPIARCLGCGRTITSPASRARGMGSGCWRKAHRRDRIAALAADYTARQIADAIETVELGGVVHLRGRIFLVVGHEGEVYRCTAEIGQCACKAGLRGVHCLHTAAVRLVAA
jgi:hypothetical protein